MASTLTDRINGVNGGVAQKAPVRCATTANITLEGEQTIDGVATSGSDVLVKDQTDTTENGIWVTSTGSWVRRPDADGVRDLVRGTEVYVTDGTVNANTLWSLQASSDPIVPGTTAITFENFSNIITSGYLPVTLTSPASGEYIRYNGSVWANYDLMAANNAFTGNNSFSGNHTLTGDFIVPMGTELTVASNTITFTRMNHPVGSGGAASVDVNTMAGGADGTLFLTSAADAAETINFKHGVDNVYVPTLTDISLDNTGRYVGWIYDPTTSNYVALFDGTTKEYVDATIASNAALYQANFLHVQDQKSTGTDGGSSSATTWNPRTLNTVVTNSISGSSLSSNQITLPAATYYIEVSAPAYNVTGNQLRLYDVTGTATILTGKSHYSNSTVENQAELFGRFTLSTSSALRLDHYTVGATATFGLGVASDSGETEIYADVRIWKVS